MLGDDIKQALLPASDGVTLIITIGNTLRSDDAAGPYVFDTVTDVHDRIFLINAGNQPENCIDEAVKILPKKTILIDAADFGGYPGEARLIESEFIPDSTLSTHTFPLKVIARIIEEDTESTVQFLGIQASSFELGENLSDPVKTTCDAIAECLSVSCRSNMV